MLEYPELIIVVLALVLIAVLTCITVVHTLGAWKHQGKGKPFLSWHKQWCQGTPPDPKPSTPPQSGDILSNKPDKTKPWCTHCRVHTRYDHTRKKRTDSEGRTCYVDVYSCRHCKTDMGIPAKLNWSAWYLGILCAVIGGPVHTALAYSPDICVVKRGPYFNLIVFWIPFIIWPAIGFGLYRWFGRVSGYRSWLQWAKEQQ